MALCPRAVKEEALVDGKCPRCHNWLEPSAAGIPENYVGPKGQRFWVCRCHEIQRETLEGAARMLEKRHGSLWPANDDEAGYARGIQAACELVRAHDPTPPHPRPKVSRKDVENVVKHALCGVPYYRDKSLRGVMSALSDVLDLED
jgi:hypothetical protein